MTTYQKKSKFNAISVTVLFMAMVLAAGCKHQEQITQQQDPPSVQSEKLSPSPEETPPVLEHILEHINVHPPGTSGMGKRTVIAVHGLGDTAEHFAELFKRDLTIPAEVLLPRAPTPHGAGGSWFPVAIPVADSPKDALRKDVAGAAGLLCQFIEAQKLERKPVITGFSQGGILSYAVAVTCPDKIHAAVPVSGFLPLDVPKDKSIPPVIAFHGTADKIVDFEWDKATVQKLFEAKVDVKLYQFPDVAHTISDDMYERWFNVLKGTVK